MLTVVDFLNSYTNRREAEKSPRTIEEERRYLQKYIEPILKKQLLLTVKTAHIDAVLKPILTAGKMRTAQAVYTFIKTASKQNKHLASAMKGVARPMHKSAEIRYLQPDDARKLILYGSDRWRAVWLIILTLGLRRGEVAGLRWCDIDFKSEQIHIRNQRQAVSGRVIDKEPKSESGKRTLPLLPAIAQQLEKLRAVHEAEDLLGIGSPYVFQGKNGGLHPSSIDHALKRDCKTLGLRPISVHGLRHTFATSSITAGANLKVLSDCLGHAAITTTCKFYAHVDMLPKQDLCNAVCGTYAKST